MSDWVYWFIGVQLVMDVFIIIRLDFHGSWLRKINEVLELMNKGVVS